ncbi:hypothetical protein K491DRAFT_287688 [Lophiostoma macrostomum CBS 122681]|uniref:Uncharacterized protein n=1 Tax=Lophiostoma macrostomum CBS 122681 TaxID=1314788 RepID=A0A6A6TTT6_9PLEO|nr:hypothetical protein K491DRAFT_287688 [Lophiostoma macrostomum CBS 122681]
MSGLARCPTTEGHRCRIACRLRGATRKYGVRNWHWQLLATLTPLRYAFHRGTCRRACPTDRRLSARDSHSHLSRGQTRSARLSCPRRTLCTPQTSPPSIVRRGHLFASSCPASADCHDRQTSQPALHTIISSAVIYREDYFCPWNVLRCLIIWAQESYQNS